MGILNLTPDSFSDGGQLASVDDAVRRAEQMASEGVDMLDLGGESTRPGAQRVSAEEQIRRVIPALAAIRKRLPDIPISIDTTLSKVAQAALDEGADAINDVSAGMEDPLVLDLVAQRRAGIVLMHRLKPPGEDVFSDRYTQEPDYATGGGGGVVETVKRFLGERVAAALQAGCARESIVVDPGLGFGKSVAQNAELIRRVAELSSGFPVLSALSRKSFVAKLSGTADMADRLPGTVALSVFMLERGCRLFRVHDVREHRLALDAAWNVLRELRG